MKKIIFTDMDETLLRSDKTISKFTYDFIGNFTAAGNKFVLSSGRALDSIKLVRKDLGLTMPGIYLCASNGALGYDCDADTIMYESRMNMDDVKGVWELAKEMGVYVHTYTDTALMFEKYTPENALYLKYSPLPVIISNKPWEDLDKPPFKIIAIDLKDKQKLTDFASTVIENFPSLDSFFSSQYFLEVIDRSAGKGNGLIKIASMLDIPLDNCYAFGDEENDISMIQAAGHGIAMINSNPTVFRFCDEITKFDNNGDGLARHMINLLSNQN